MRSIPRESVIAAVGIFEKNAEQREDQPSAELADRSEPHQRSLAGLAVPRGRQTRPRQHFNGFQWRAAIHSHDLSLRRWRGPLLRPRRGVCRRCIRSPGSSAMTSGSQAEGSEWTWGITCRFAIMVRAAPSRNSARRGSLPAIWTRTPCAAKSSSWGPPPWESAINTARRSMIPTPFLASRSSPRASAIFSPATD